MSSKKSITEPLPDVPSAVEHAKRGHDPNQKHFETSGLLSDLKGRTISSGMVTVTSQAIQFALNIGSIAVLARLLLPQDFGLVAMVATIMGFVRIFNDAGLSTATVQRAEITHAQVSNLFWVNVGLGGAMSLALALCSPLIAWFFREPRLVWVTVTLSATFLMGSSTVQHLALLRRQMRFRSIAIIEISSVSTGILVGIGLALSGYGYWSLVWVQLSASAALCVGTWFSSRWRPQWPQRRSGTRPLLHFGANLTASSLLWSLARGSDGLLIGRTYGSEALGLYSRASALLIRPIQQLIGPIESVFIPMLSRLQDDAERYRRTALQAYEAVAVGSFLFTGLLFALSQPLTAVVLGPHWTGAAPIFAGFTLVALFTPVASVSSWLLTTQCRGREFLVLSSISSTMTFLSFVAGLYYGPVGVATGYSCVSILVLLPTQFYIAGRTGPVSTADLWGRFFLHLPIWLVVCASTFFARTLVINARPVVQLLFSAGVGVAVGLTFISLYRPSRRVAAGFLSIFGNWVARRRTPGKVVVPNAT